jgi:hypothetical protein
MTMNPALRGFLIVVCAGFLLYLPLLSVQWDPNGIIEARSIEQGPLISANHLLYRPLGAVLLNAAEGIGLTPPLPLLYQILTAIISALGLGAFFVAVSFLTRNARAAWLATALYATSWAYWTFSTDIYYITLAAAGASAVLAVLAYPVKVWRGVVIAAFFFAVAVFAWQASIFLLPVFVILAFTRTRDKKFTVLFTMSALALVALVYLAVGIFALHLYSVTALGQWLTSHSSDETGRLAMWGQWSVTRVRPLLLSAASSFVPIWEGLGISSLRRGVETPEFFLRQVSIVALFVIVAVTLWQARQKRPVLFQNGTANLSLRGAPSAMRWSSSPQSQNDRLQVVNWKIAALVALGYLALLPFILWWDPFEPKWFVVGNVFLIGAAAILWAVTFSARSFAMLAICIVIIALANFTATIFPRHTRPNPELALAACVTQQANAQDTLVLTEWGWFDYADYFDHYPGAALTLVGDGQQTEKIARIHRAITTARAQNGRVLMRDFKTMTDDQRALSKTLTGMDAGAFTSFQSQPAFTCDGQKFDQLK